MQAEHTVIRPIRPEDDAPLSRIIRSNLEQFHLDIPGTAYFDPELDHLSRYYRAAPDRRAYFLAVDGAGRVLGGVGLAEFSGFSLRVFCIDDLFKAVSKGKRKNF